MFVPFFKALVLLTALCVTSAHALTVEVVAPEELKVLLMQHLETARAGRLGEKLDAEEMARLQRQSELTARDLLATEGYFSPQVNSAVEWMGDDWRVEYQVIPGAQTQVRSVKLDFDGALKMRPDADKLRKRIVSNFSLKPGMPFRQADWDAAKQAVLRP
ncbi:MAG: autotransporter assembly complex protein TamA, partial [Thiobacillus sp.]